MPESQSANEREIESEHSGTASMCERNGSDGKLFQKYFRWQEARDARNQNKQRVNKNTVKPKRRISLIKYVFLISHCLSSETGVE